MFSEREPVDRNEAIAVLKEITAKCSYVSLIDLIPPKSKDVLSRGYRINIKTLLNDQDRKEIQKIIDSHRLAIKEKDENIIVYKSS